MPKNTQSARMKWFTCTPISLPGDEQRHFTRDTGLLCKGFQQIGVDSKNIMALPWFENDNTVDLIRVEYSKFEDHEWWRSLNGDGVVLYGWGMGKYLNIAAAIKRAGLFLVSSIDASGLISPYVSPIDYIRLIYGKRIAQNGPILGAAIATASVAKNSIPVLLDIPRLQHLAHADVITMVTPQGVEIMKGLARRFGYPELEERIHYLPHPQLNYFKYDGRPKENMVLTVGRWDHSAWFQKNPKLFVASIGKFLETRTDYRSVIIGSEVSCLEPLIEKNCSKVADRIELIPYISSDKLVDYYCRAKISCWSSRHEGQQNTGAQALCCGSSVVSTTGIAMSCFAHYSSRSSGRQAIRNTPQYLADALSMEATAWDEGHRDPSAISSAWSEEFHVGYVTNRILEFANAR